MGKAASLKEKLRFIRPGKGKVSKKTLKAAAVLFFASTYFSLLTMVGNITVPAFMVLTPLGAGVLLLVIDLVK